MNLEGEATPVSECEGRDRREAPVVSSCSVSIFGADADVGGKETTDCGRGLAIRRVLGRTPRHEGVTTTEGGVSSSLWSFGRFGGSRATRHSKRSVFVVSRRRVATC
jgi:hypothetical protein